MPNVAQELVGAPLVIIGAGLPNTPDRLMAAGSYAERFQYQVLGPLPPPDAAAALLVPATARSVTWNQDAAELVPSRSAGAPYLIQLYADAAWRAAAPSVGGHINLGHARSGIAIATQELHSGLFRGRWNKASALEQQYLAAMALHLDTGGAASTATVAAALGRTTSQLSYIRTRLLDKASSSPPATAVLRSASPASNTSSPKKPADNCDHPPPADRGPAGHHPAGRDPWWLAHPIHHPVPRRRPAISGNLRLVATPPPWPQECTRSWCYQLPLVAVLIAAHAFDPDNEASDPPGWIKEVKTGRRPCGWLIRSKLQQHQGFGPTCPDCGNLTLG